MIKDLFKDERLKKLMPDLVSAVKKIGEEYFTLNLADYENENAFKYRERVYCYEFYHRLRESLNSDYPYVISGEVDKRGHPIIKSNKNPDFIIHSPGDMKDNFIIMEVKTLENFSKTKGKKDIETFIIFFEECNYDFGIYLIYGKKEDENKFNKNREKLNKQIKIKLSKENFKNKKVIILWHNDFGEKVEVDIIDSKKTRKLE